MSIADEITRIRTAKEDLKTAINAKGGSLADETLDNYAQAVTALPEAGTDTSDATATAEDIILGHTAYVKGEKITGTHECESWDISTGTATASDILEGKTAFAGKGLITGTHQCDGIDTSDATATSEDILSGKSAYVNGKKIYGGIPIRDSYSVSMYPGFGENVEVNSYIQTLYVTTKLVKVNPNDIRYGATLYFTDPSYGLFTGNATATAADILEGKTAGIMGEMVTGTLVPPSYYKCASVDTTAKTWSGYKAVLTDGVYSFEETVTEGLTYTKVIPVVGKTYSADALILVGNLYKGFDPNTLFLLDVDNMVDKTGNFEVATQGEFTRSPGLFGNRLEFPSMQMVAFSSSNVSFGDTEDYTVEFFYTRIGDGVYPPVFSDDAFQVHGGEYGTSLTIWQQNTDNMTIAYNSYATLGVTKHIAFSRRASDGKWKFWVNGQMVSDWNYGTGSANASMTDNGIGNWNNNRNNGFAIEEYRISRGLRYTTDTFDVPTGPLN